MTTIKLSFSALESVASASRDTASKLNAYADAIPGVANRPLSQLTMGSSSYTSSAASLASQKASSLRSTATRYSQFSNKVTSFANTAKDADQRVAKHMQALENKRSEGLGFWDKIGHFLHNAVNGVFGATPFGTAVRTVTDVLKTVHEWKKKVIRDVWEWFAHGEGRYVLNAIGAIVGTLASIAAVIGAIGSILAFPVGTIMAVAAIVALAVSVVDTVCTLKETSKALSMHSTEPGVARYYGDTSSFSDYAKKETTSASFQRFAKITNLIGDIAGLTTMVGGFFKTTTTVTSIKDGKELTKITYRVNASTFKKNLLKSIGVTSDYAHGVSFSAGHIFGFGSKAKETTSSLINVSNGMKRIIDPIDNVISTTKWAIGINDKAYTGNWNYKDATGTLGMTSKVFDGLKIGGNIKKVVNFAVKYHNGL